MTSPIASVSATPASTGAITTASRRSRHRTTPRASRASCSPSRNSSQPAAAVPPRLLRFVRLLFYSWAAPNFLYSLYVQLIVLKGPGRTPLPASVGFGRDSLFLTFHANFHCTWYACLCFLHALLSLPGHLAPQASASSPTGGSSSSNAASDGNSNNCNSSSATNTDGTNSSNSGSSPTKPQRRTRSRAARAVEWAVHRFTPLLFPLSAFVGLAYYLILHYHPLNRLRAQLVPDHDAKMALLHFNPLVFVIGDSWLKDAELFARFAFKQRVAVRSIIAYGTGYFLWTVLCTRLNGGHWPYPFQKSFSVVQHVMFVLGALLSSVYLTRMGFRLHGRLDKRRRRRIALAAANASAGMSPSPASVSTAASSGSTPVGITTITGNSPALVRGQKAM